MSNTKTVFVTGGAGFIGSSVCRHLVNDKGYNVVNLDKLTYAGNLSSLKEIENSPLYSFEQVDICDSKALAKVFAKHQPNYVMNLAAESHVDRSIDGPAEFIHTNIVGTFTILQEALKYYNSLEGGKKEAFRFHHISTDEVFGSLGKDGLFSETTPYDPRSPYSASKASSDHLVNAWHHTFGLPMVLTNCSNNYGPYHFPEKLIPLVILNALDGKDLPIYGKGDQIRDWLYVEDHARALVHCLEHGKLGESYNIGGRNEKTNLEVVQTICAILDELQPKTNGKDYAEQITFVADRPGHDMRYAIDNTKIQNELGWQPQETFESGIKKTVQWYLSNEWWWQPLQQAAFERRGKA